MLIVDVIVDGQVCPLTILTRTIDQSEYSLAFVTAIDIRPDLYVKTQSSPIRPIWFTCLRLIHDVVDAGEN